MPPQNQISKNAGSLKGGNFWQNFQPQQKFTLDHQYAENKPLINSPLFMGPGTTDLSSATYGTSYFDNRRGGSLPDFLDIKSIIKSGGRKGAAAIPIGKRGILSGYWDISGKSRQSHKAKLELSVLL